MIIFNIVFTVKIFLFLPNKFYTIMEEECVPIVYLILSKSMVRLQFMNEPIKCKLAGLGFWHKIHSFIRLNSITVNATL